MKGATQNILNTEEFWNRDPVPSGKNILTFQRNPLASYFDDSSRLL